MSSLAANRTSDQLLVMLSHQTYLSRGNASAHAHDHRTERHYNWEAKKWYKNKSFRRKIMQYDQEYKAIAHHLSMIGQRFYTDQ